jgi:hypothetical protein
VLYTKPNGRQWLASYEEMVTWARASQLTQEEATRGETTVSIETQPEFFRNGFDETFRANLPDTLKIIRSLSREDQEMLLSYHLLQKNQKSMAVVYPHKTQTLMSYHLRRASLALGAFLLFGNPINRKAVSAVLEKAGHEQNNFNGQRVATSALIEAYAKCRNFERVAEAYGIRKPDVRRTLSRASKKLLKSSDMKELALGAYILGLIVRTSKIGIKKALPGHTYISDPAILGQFVIDVNDPNFEVLFTSRANQRADIDIQGESVGNQSFGSTQTYTE